MLIGLSTVSFQGADSCGDRVLHLYHRKQLPVTLQCAKTCDKINETRHKAGIPLHYPGQMAG